MAISSNQKIWKCCWYIWKPHESPSALPVSGRRRRGSMTWPPRPRRRCGRPPRSCTTASPTRTGTERQRILDMFSTHFSWNLDTIDERHFPKVQLKRKERSLLCQSRRGQFSLVNYPRDLRALTFRLNSPRGATRGATSETRVCEIISNFTKRFILKIMA